MSRRVRSKESCWIAIFAFQFARVSDDTNSVNLIGGSKVHRLTCSVLQDLLKAVKRSTGLLVRGVLGAVREPPTSRDHCEKKTQAISEMNEDLRRGKRDMSSTHKIHGYVISSIQESGAVWQT